MKYRLINQKTGEEHFCQKIVIDEFDYYVGDEKINSSNYKDFNFWFYNPYIKELQINCNPNSCHKVIATNNPNIDIPKVVDKVEKLAWDIINNNSSLIEGREQVVAFTAFYEGYNKSQETHPFSEEDMIEFAIWRSITVIDEPLTPKGELQLWKEQKPKIIYYA